MTETPRASPARAAPSARSATCGEMPSEYEIVTAGSKLDAAAEPGRDVRAEPVVGRQPVVPDLPGELTAAGRELGRHSATRTR